MTDVPEHIACARCEPERCICVEGDLGPEQAGREQPLSDEDLTRADLRHARTLSFDGERMWDDDRQEVNHLMTRAQAEALARPRRNERGREQAACDCPGCMGGPVPHDCPPTCAGCLSGQHGMWRRHERRRERTLEQLRDEVRALLDLTEQLRAERDHLRSALALGRVLAPAPCPGCGITLHSHHGWDVPCCDGCDQQHHRQTAPASGSAARLADERDEARRLARWLYRNGGQQVLDASGGGDTSEWPWLLEEDDRG